MRWCVRVRVCTLVLMRWCRYAGTTNALRCLLLDGHFKARLHLHALEPDCSYSQLTQRRLSTATVVKCQTILRSANISDLTLSSSSQCIASMFDNCLERVPEDQICLVCQEICKITNKVIILSSLAGYIKVVGINLTKR